MRAMRRRKTERPEAARADEDRAFVEVSDLAKAYGEGDGRTQVLRGLSMSVDQGSSCVILGASGSGKSTLLNLIGGLDTADAGSIRVAGCEVTALAPRRLVDYRRELLGFVFQLYNLVPNLTVRENVQVCANLSDDPLDLDDLLDTLGLAAHADRFPGQLSGGQQQRCAIGRALVKNPRLLLCDEPTGALDSHTAHEILALLEDVNRRLGTTMLIVTHNEGICPLVDMVVRIRDGRIVDAHHNARKVPARELRL